MMDLLLNPASRKAILKEYQSSSEPRLVRRAIKVARWKEYTT